MAPRLEGGIEVFMIMSCMIRFCFSGKLSQKIVLPIFSTSYPVTSSLTWSEFTVLQINGNANSETPGPVSVPVCLSPQGFIMENVALS